jgi:hypothetical protein
MTREETSRTAEASNGSPKPIMTTINESLPTLFGPTGVIVSRAPQAPDSGNLWAQIRSNLEPAAKLLPLAWSAFLLIGGLNFLYYYGTIDFMPELDLKASLTLLATSAAIGTFLLVMMSAILISPALSWLGVRNNKTLKALWYDEGAEFPRRSAILWFILPLAAFNAASLLMVIGWQWWGKLSTNVGFPVSLILILFITGWLLWRRLPDCLKRQDKWTAMYYLLSNTFFSMMLFCPLLGFVNVIVKSDQSYNTYYPISLILIMCFLLAYNTALVKASFLPGLKFFLFGTSTLIFLNLYIPFAPLVPKVSMSWFQFGNIRHASLILDDVGCNISRSHGLSVEKHVPDPKTCMLPDVMILSRLGTPYYIEAHPENATSKRFTIPSQHVLSWSIRDLKGSTTPGSP